MKEIIGQTINYLYVDSLAEKPKHVKSNVKYYNCLCLRCGKHKIISGNSLRNKIVQSCGCLQKERASKANKKCNAYDLSGEYGVGYTLKGEEFWFDLEDYEKIKIFCWYMNPEGYLIADFYDNNEHKHIRLHRLVMDVSDEYEVDHIKHKTFDNRKAELRIATKSNNAMNQKLKSNNTSGTTGVYWNKRKEKWDVTIGINQKYIFIGSFVNKVDAIKARKEAEEKYYGEWSYGNSMLEVSSND